MKPKHLLLLLLATTGIYFTGYSQFDYKAQFVTKALKSAKTITLVTNDVDPNMEKGNLWLDAAMKKYWTATKPEFATAKYSEIKNKKSTDIYIGIVRTINNALYDNKGPEDNTFYTLTFLSSDKGDKPQMNTLHPRVYFNRSFDELDVISAICLLNNYAAASIKGSYDNNVRVSTSLTPPYYRLSELNRGKLKGKTLLLDKAQVDKKLDEAGIRESYPYKFKLVTRQEILEAIKNNTPQTAYFQSEAFVDDHTGGLIMAPVIIDAETGYMLSYSKVTSVVMTNSSNPKPAVATKANLKEIVKNAE